MALSELAIAAIGIGVASISADVLHTSSNTKRKRRGTSNYEATPIQRGYGGVNNINPIKDINPINNLKGINNNVLNSIHPIRPVVNPFTPRTIYKNPEFDEFTDPLQVNSIGDVLFNQEGRDIIMEDLGVDWVDDIPILGSIAETIIVGVDMVIDKYAKPILNGEFSKAFITGLNGLGEDLDTIDLANTVKGFIIEKDKSKAFNRSLGFGNEGKYNYNFDTGNGVQDFLLEVVSSPGTWITAVKGAISSGIKSVSKTALKESASTIAAKTGVDAASEAVEAMIKRASRLVSTTFSNPKLVTDTITDITADYVTKSLSKNSVNFAREFTEAFNKHMLDITGSRLVTALRIVKPLDDVNDALSMMALKTYLTGGSYWLLKKTADPIVDAMKSSTLRGLQKLSKKGSTEFDLVKTVDNAIVKDIVEEGQKMTVYGRLKYGEALGFLREFGEPKAFDDRLTGMVRSIKDTNDPEEIFTRLLDMFEKEGVNTTLMKSTPEFKDFVIGTAEGSGYILKAASALNVVEDALNKNFKYMRGNILGALAGSKTNLEAFTRLERYFKERGIALREYLDNTDELIKNTGKKLSVYKKQKDFIENLMKELGFDKNWVSDNINVLKRTLNIVDGVEPDELLPTLTKEIKSYNTRGKALLREAKKLKMHQTQIWKIMNKDSYYMIRLDKLLGNPSLSAYDKVILDNVMKILDSDAPITGLIKYSNEYFAADLEDSVVFDIIIDMTDKLEPILDEVDDALADVKILHASPTSPYARNPFADVDAFDNTPDGLYTQLKGAQFQIEALGKEDIDTSTYLTTLVNQPSIIKVFETPIKSTELAKSLNRVTFKKSEEFLELLKAKGVAKSITEHIPETKLNMILDEINKVELVKGETVVVAGEPIVDNGIHLIKGKVKYSKASTTGTKQAIKQADETLNSFEVVLDEVMQFLYGSGIKQYDNLDDVGDYVEDLLYEGLADGGIKNLPEVIDDLTAIVAFYDMAPVVKKHRTVTKEMLPAYMDAIENASNRIEKTIAAYNIKEDLGESVNPALYLKLKSIQSKLNETYYPLMEYVTLTGTSGRAYQLKLLQIFNRIENLNRLDETIYHGMSTLDIIVDMASDDPQSIIGGIVKELSSVNATDDVSNNFKEIATTIRNKAQSTVNYMKLQKEIYDLNPGHGLDDAFLDILEGFYKEDLSTFVYSKAELEEALIFRTGAGKANGKMKLENYYNKYVKKPGDAPLRAHDAIDDVEMERRVLQHLHNKGDYVIPEGKTIVVFDLETTGTSLKQATLGDADILQLAATRYVMVNGNLEKIDSFLEYGKPRRTTTPEIDKLLGEDTIRLANASDKTSSQLVNEFKEWAGDSAVSGHNIAEFDLPYMNKFGDYEAPEVIDTLEILKTTTFKHSLYKKKNIDGFKQYVDDAYELFKAYAAKQADIGQPLVSTVDAKFTDDLYNLFNPLDFQLQKMDKTGLNAISSEDLEEARSYVIGKAESGVDYTRKQTPEGTDSFDTTTEGTSMIKTIRQVLIDTKTTNMEQANWFITTDALQKEFKTENIMTVMNTLNDGRYSDQFILNKFGVRTIWKPDHLNILNKLPERIDGVSPLQLEKFRTSLDRFYESTFDSNVVYNSMALYKMRRYIQEDFGNTVWMKYVDLDTLSMHEMNALYQVLSSKNIVGGTRVKPANFDNVREVMRAPVTSASNMKAISYVEDPEQLSKSYDVLEDAVTGNYNEHEIDEAIAYILANGDDTDAYRMINYMERDYTSFIMDEGTFDEDWFAKTTRSEFDTNHPITQEARDMVTAKKNINATAMSQYKGISEQRFINQTRSVLGLTPESLTKYMHEHSYITYVDAADFDVFKDELQYILDNKKLYNDAGISIKQQDDRFILYLNKNYEARYAEITKDVEYKTSYQGVIDQSKTDPTLDAYLEAYNKSDKRIRAFYDSPFDSFNTVYNRIDAKKHRLLTEDMKLNDLVSDAYKNDFYTRINQVDFPVLGSVNTIKSVDPYAVTDMTSAQIKELNRSLKLSGARNKYIQILFSDNYTLKRNVLWDKLSDEQILNILKDNKKLSVVVLHEKNGRIMARKINPTNLDHIRSIRNLNGSIFPTDMANKITGTINDYDSILKENHPLLYKWREYVVSTYKVLYLTSMGVLFRNGLDIIGKNTATLGEGPIELPNVIKYNMQAWKLWDNYSKTVADIMGGPDGNLTEWAISNYFKIHPELDYRMFEFVHRYATSSASAGMAKAQQEAVKSFNFSKNGIKTNVYKHALFENQIVKTLMSTNAHIEHAGRLGLLLQSIEEGRVFDDAIQDVLRTHFDYTNLSYAEMLAETFIPFITFPIRNLEYWKDTIKGNMWLIELMLDATTETNQMHSQTQFMIDNSKSLQNSLSNGNVRVLNSIIKTSPSAFDAARLVLQPADILADYSESDFNRRVIAPLRVPRQKDLYGNVNTFDTKTKEYLRNVTAIYQVERPLGVVGNILGINDGNVDNIADVLPSIASEKKDKLGNMTGDMRMYQYLPYGYTLQSIVGAGFRRDAAGERIIQKVTPPKTKVSIRAGYSKQRIPYVKRYYSNSYNFYNRWKAQSYMRKNAMRNLPPTPESLENTIRNVFFMNNLTPLKMNYLQYKQRNQFR